MSTDYYGILGLSPNATASEIKDAYRTQAKAAHPDAGGSVEKMAKVNEAYRELSDPAARSAYDAHRADTERAARHHAQSATARHDSPHYASEPHPAHHEEAAHINRERAAWARNSAWEIARFSAPLAVGGVIISRIIFTRLPDFSARLVMNFLVFIPVYLLALSLIFLFNPALRLVFADFVRRFPTTKQERKNALVTVLAFFPLAAIWTLVFSR